MKVVLFADKSLFIGDDVAGALVEYARLLADTSGADSVSLAGINAHGNLVNATFLLNSTSVILMQSTSRHVEAPDNSLVVRYLMNRIDALTKPVQPQPRDDWDAWERDFDASH